MCGGKKIKIHWVGWSVGLPVVELKYGLYVVHLSKWFVYAIKFKIRSVFCRWNGRPTIGYNGLQAEAVPVLREAKYTNVQRDFKIEDAGHCFCLLLATSALTHSI